MASQPLATAYMYPYYIIHNNTIILFEIKPTSAGIKYTLKELLMWDHPYPGILNNGAVPEAAGWEQVTVTLPANHQVSNATLALARPSRSMDSLSWISVPIHFLYQAYCIVFKASAYSYLTSNLQYTRAFYRLILSILIYHLKVECVFIKSA